MSRFTRELALQHTRARVLAAGARDICETRLSAFEVDLLEELARRRKAFGANAAITAAEAAILQDVLQALETGYRRAFSEATRAMVGRLVTIARIEEAA